MDSPIRIQYNANRLYMEGLHGVLDIRIDNIAPGESFDTSLTITSRVIREPISVQRSLEAGDSCRRQIPLFLPLPTETIHGSAGDAHLSVELIVTSSSEGRHRFSGEFVIPVLAHLDHRNEVNVTISKLIENTGDRGGWGAVNDINLGGVAITPGETINDLLSQQRDPKFESIELRYEGADLLRRSSINEREEALLTKCTLEDDASDQHLLVLTGDSITLGRAREQATITTWLMPRTVQNDQASSKISAQHCRLSRTHDGLLLSPTSPLNPLRCNDQVITQPTTLRLDEAATLSFPGGLRLTLTPIESPAIPAVVLDAWIEDSPAFARRREWADRHGIGGLAIGREDGLAGRESYLWVFSAVPIPMARADPPGVIGSFFLALPTLHVARIAPGQELTVSGRRFEANMAHPLAVADQLAAGTAMWKVAAWAQLLAESDC